LCLSFRPQKVHVLSFHNGKDIDLEVLSISKTKQFIGYISAVQVLDTGSYNVKGNNQLIWWLFCRSHKNLVWRSRRVETVMENVAKGRVVLFVLAVLVHRSSSLWELEVRQDDTQPLSKIALHRSTQKLDESITISANPVLLGQKVYFSQLHLTKVPSCLVSLGN